MHANQNRGGWLLTFSYSSAIHTISARCKIRLRMEVWYHLQQYKYTYYTSKKSKQNTTIVWFENRKKPLQDGNNKHWKEIESKNEFGLNDTGKNCKKAHAIWIALNGFDSLKEKKNELRKNTQRSTFDTRHQKFKYYIWLHSVDKKRERNRHKLCTKAFDIIWIEKSTTRQQRK